MPNPVTGTHSCKKYRCQTCGHVVWFRTNHWGECYSKCRVCGWKHPMQAGQVHVCQEPVPEDMGTPMPWKMVPLGEVADIRLGASE